MARKIAVLTSSRADFAHLQWPLHALHAHAELEPTLIVTGAHLSDEFGMSVAEIEAAGFAVNHRVECLLSADTDTAMAKTIGVATLGLADLLGQLRPDLLLLIADRYEMLAPASVALALRIPIAHIEGGEISEGAIDDAVRNALTKLAHLHFTPTTAARERVIAMGEEAWRVHAVGAPSIDTLVNERLLERHELEAALGHCVAERFVLAALHPLTLADNTLTEVDATFAALNKVDRQLLFCFPNADAGSRAIVRRARESCAARAGDAVFVNVSPRVYWSLLSHAEMLVGNSSSGIMETPALRIPTVNVGERQRGRERARNIIDAPAHPDAIVAAMTQARSRDFHAQLDGMTCPYGDGHAGPRIAAALAAAPDRGRLLAKRALPVGTGPAGPAFLQTDEDEA